MASKSLEEIERQIKALQAEAEELKVAEGIAQLRAIIRKYKVGLPHFKIALGESKTPKQATPKRAPTYFNPANPAQTWSGRGRKPRWLVAALDAGGKIDQCRIGYSAPPEPMPEQLAL